MVVFITLFATMPTAMARAAVCGEMPVAALRAIEIVSASTSVRPSTAPVASRPPSPNHPRTSATANSTTWNVAAICSAGQICSGFAACPSSGPPSSADRSHSATTASPMMNGAAR